MKLAALFFIIGLVLGILRYFNFLFYTPWWIIICCFVMWILLAYVSIHKKNKERRTPRPVYYAPPQ